MAPNTSTIERCAVLGAGLMGSGIAAHLANAGLPVLLLDMPAKEGPRNGAAASAIERLKKADPQPLMMPDAAKLITPGNFDDDLPKLAAFNFVLDDVLEGGVNASLGLDGHGKSLSFLLLDMPVEIG